MMRFKLSSSPDKPALVSMQAVFFVVLCALAAWAGYQFTDTNLERVGEPIWLSPAQLTKPSSSLATTRSAKNTISFQLTAAPSKTSDSAFPAFSGSTPGLNSSEWVLRDDVLYGLWEISVERPAKLLDKPLTPPIWRIVGTSTSGTVSHALVVVEGQPQMQTVPVGAVLPTGERILAVNQDYVTMQAAGSRLYLLLGR